MLSPRSATVAVSNVPSGSPPASLPIPGEIIYLPTAAGPSAGHVGYVVGDGADAAALSSQIAGAMHSGQHLTIALAGGGTLVLNGATLTFAVLSPIAAGGSTPHG